METVYHSLTFSTVPSILILDIVDTVFITKKRLYPLITTITSISDITGLSVNDWRMGVCYGTV